MKGTWNEIYNARKKMIVLDFETACDNSNCYVNGHFFRDSYNGYRSQLYVDDGKKVKNPKTGEEKAKEAMAKYMSDQLIELHNDRATN